MDQGGPAFKAFVAPVLHFPHRGGSMVTRRRQHVTRLGRVATPVRSRGPATEEDWAARESGGAATLVDYTLTPLEALGERFHTSPKLRRALNAGKNFALFWDAKGDQSKAKIWGTPRSCRAW